MFRTVPLSIISSCFHCTHSNGTCRTGLLTACELMMDRNCPKHVEFYSKNKFEKLVKPVGFIIRSYHDARSHERQNLCNVFSRTQSKQQAHINNTICIQ